MLNLSSLVAKLDRLGLGERIQLKSLKSLANEHRYEPRTTYAEARAPDDYPENHVKSATGTEEILRSVWEHQRGRVNDRIELIDQATCALAKDRLDADLRAEAERAAHMLAGSLGMFGFLDASDTARELESMLAHPTPDHATALLTLAHRLRNGVQGPVALSSDGAADRSRQAAC